MLEVHGDDLEADFSAVVGISASAPIGWDALAVVLVVVAVGVLAGAEEGHHSRLIAGAGLFLDQHHFSTFHNHIQDAPTQQMASARTGT